MGNAAPVAILLGGILAFFAAYSYVKLAVYFKDEGATYSFFKRTFPQSPFAASVIGWFVVFGYISTLALYAFTFASYFISLLPITDFGFTRDVVADSIIVFFTIVNITSVKGMGKLEDLLVYTKVTILLAISGLFLVHGEPTGFEVSVNDNYSTLSLLTVAAITFVAFEGFQLVIHAYNETVDPDKNVPYAIYSALIAALVLYLALSMGALSAIPKELLIRDKEFALAAGAASILGKSGQFLVIFGALLATSSAISGTLFGASRLMAVIASDGYLPNILAKRRLEQIPVYSVITMSLFAMALILTGGLETILEFGSITFLIVSNLMAVANYKLRKQTNTQGILAIIAIVGLSLGAALLLYYEYTTDTRNLLFILGIYTLLLGLSAIYAKINKIHFDKVT